MGGLGTISMSNDQTLHLWAQIAMFVILHELINWNTCDFNLLLFASDKTALVKHKAIYYLFLGVVCENTNKSLSQKVI